MDATQQLGNPAGEPPALGPAPREKILGALALGPPAPSTWAHQCVCSADIHPAGTGRGGLPFAWKPPGGTKGGVEGCPYPRGGPPLCTTAGRGRGDLSAAVATSQRIPASPGRPGGGLLLIIIIRSPPGTCPRTEPAPHRLRKNLPGGGGAPAAPQLPPLPLTSAAAPGKLRARRRRGQG